MPERKESAAKRGYDYRWQMARVAFLRAHPLCVFCQRAGRLTAASVVDHVVPHRGDQALFWDSSNWQPLCKPCHDGTKKEIENSGTERGCDAKGFPLSKSHHWNQ